MPAFKLTICVTLLLISFAAFPQASLPPLTDSIESKILNETRGLQVILPKDYKPGSNEKFEVVYILDGEWYHELVPFTYNFAESAHYIPKSMFVLIRNRYRDGVNLRGRDFSPTKIPEDSLSGGADRFYDFLTKEVVPYIESKYPVKKQRTLVGSSFSGLFGVYAFEKDPAFFQSFVTSDPSLFYDNNYTLRIAEKTLSHLPEGAGTLFIGCLESTSRNMGSWGFDSILKKSAPKNLHWKVIQYPGESHYSVQLKAFYDGFRFSHEGFGIAPQFHPMGGLIDPKKPIMFVFTNDPEHAKYTTDGSMPDSSSKKITALEMVSITPPQKIRTKIEANRVEYSTEDTAVFEKGKIVPPKSSSKVKAGLKYSMYTIPSDSLPATVPEKAEKSGIVDSTFQIAKLTAYKPTLFIIDGSLEIPQDGDYVFYAYGCYDLDFQLAGKAMLTGPTKQSGSSYAVSLERGRYPVKLSLAARLGDTSPQFMIFKLDPGKQKWWEGEPWKKL